MAIFCILSLIFIHFTFYFLAIPCIFYVYYYNSLIPFDIFFRYNGIFVHNSGTSFRSGQISPKHIHPELRSSREQLVVFPLKLHRQTRGRPPFLTKFTRRLLFACAKKEGKPVAARRYCVATDREAQAKYTWNEMKGINSVRKYWKMGRKYQIEYRNWLNVNSIYCYMQR